MTKQKDAQEEQLQVNLESLQTEIRPLIEKKEQFETKLMDLQVAVDESKAALILSESELKICKENETSEKRKYETLQSALTESRQSLEARKSEIAGHEESLPALRLSLETKRKELQENKVEEQNLSRKLHAQRADVSSLENLGIFSLLFILLYLIDRGENEINASNAIEQQSAWRTNEAENGRKNSWRIRKIGRIRI